MARAAEPILAGKVVFTMTILMFFRRWFSKALGSKASVLVELCFAEEGAVIICLI